MEAVDKMLAQDISPLMSLITKEEAGHHVEPQVKGDSHSMTKANCQAAENIVTGDLIFTIYLTNIFTKIFEIKYSWISFVRPNYRATKVRRIVILLKNLKLDMQ